MRMVFIGPPGAGKGSLAAVIKEVIGIEHLSSGDMLRDEMKRGSKVGLELKGLIDKGALVPDETITKLVEQKVSVDLKGAKGFALDGFPRTTQQAKDLDIFLDKIGQPLNFVLCMDASLETVLDRLTTRRICRKCGALFNTKYVKPKIENVCDVCNGELYQRSDDNEETIRKRMQVYNTSTKPIIDYYDAQGKLRRIDANKETGDIRKDLTKILDENKFNQN
ncbi:MAG: adenylate kinase [Candidatus Omnitrophota bacterium]